ncbi:MAG: glycosyltransferase [Anaerocolumna sp.]
MKKKLLFVISQLFRGGAETSLVNLLNNLDYDLYDIDFLVLNHKPIKNAVSLLCNINRNINICDAYEEYQNINIGDRIHAKLVYSSDVKGAYYITALDFVRNKIYDWAFFVGEWHSPSFVAFHVEAKTKAAWIHSDISKAGYFDADHFFYFYDKFEYFIFVSENSLRSSVKAYPFIKEKSITINNILDVKDIKVKALEKVDLTYDKSKPMLLTCANFRQEKNHLRQVRVLSELKKRGLDLLWVNIGSTADEILVNEVKELCISEKIDNNFIILGPKDNPYPYMKMADAVTVLSDHESWSMVITEAKIIGTPVISTKTSGALEQIEHQITGILTGFDISDIANKIEEFISNQELQSSIKENIYNFDNTSVIMESFNELIVNEEHLEETRNQVHKSILYVVDDINYVGGAHGATKLQIKELLNTNKDITIFSTTIPNLKTRQELLGVKFKALNSIREDKIYNKRVIDCMFNNTVNRREKINKIKQFILQKYLHDKNFYDDNVLGGLKNIFEGFETVCITSEGSAYRSLLANSNCNNKIQWIHTDYCAWREFNEWTRFITKNDEKIYKKFNSIVLLSENIKYKFDKLYPVLADKTIVIKNLIPSSSILSKASCIDQEYESVHFVTVGRLSKEKALSRLFNILRKLKENNYKFTWEIIGDGEEVRYLEDLIKELDLSDNVTILGYKKNPYKFMKKAQVFALLSNYEGVPNTIYEALILRLPVLATNVGGINDQIINGVNGWLAENDEESIYNTIKHILENPNEIEQAKKNIEEYIYDNDIIIKSLNKLF